MMTPTLMLLASLAAPDTAALALAREMNSAPLTLGQGDVRSHAEMLYAYAFAGYALTDDVLRGNLRDADAVPVLDDLIARMAQPFMGKDFGLGWTQVGGHTVSKSVGHRGHLLLLLMARARLAPALSPSQQALADDLAAGLVKDIAASPNHLLPTYGKRAWGADNEVALAGLRLHHSDGADAMHDALRTLEKDRLPPSEIVPWTLKPHDVPRGCALSWSVAMRAQHAPQEADALYARYREAYWVKWGPVAGFREWPRGVERKEDFDSGPIVFGIGTAASGIGLAAARMISSEADVDTLSRSATLAGLGVIEGQKGAWMMRAMAAWARNAVRFDTVRYRPH